MRDNSRAILEHIPYLRRHARLLTGSQEVGDEYIRICLEMIHLEPHHLDGDDLRVQLFRAFHAVWSAVTATITRGARAEQTDLEQRLEQGLAALSPVERRVLLLVVVEEFTYDQVARILGIEVDEVRSLLNQARQGMRGQIAVPVLIIEDEPLIAMELSRIMQDMGHTVVGVANRRDAAVREADHARPGLILADVQLIDDDSGIAAAQDILGRFDVPVVFVTGFPERLLTGGRLEPAFVVAKPFEEDTLKVTVAQALAVYASPGKASVHRRELMDKLAAITGVAVKPALS